jgi:hypothetical protein
MPNELTTAEVRPQGGRIFTSLFLRRLAISITLTLLDVVAIRQSVQPDVLGSLDGICIALLGAVLSVMLGTLAHIWSLTLRTLASRKRRV